MLTPLPQTPAPQRNVQRKDPNASSFCFGGDAPAAPQGGMSLHQMRQKKNEFVDNRVGGGVANENNNAPQQQQQRGGFGDTGHSSIRMHHAPGGKSSGNIIGGWN